MIEYTSRAGNLIYYASPQELEALPGYRSNGHKGRACCPIHNGDNPTALEIDWGTGWASCFACGDAFSIRIGDPPQTGAYRHDSTRAQRPERLQDAPERAQSRKTRNTLTADPNALERLHSLAAVWADAYATSPAAEYVRDRAIPDHIAQRLGWGYVSDNAYLSRHRLFIPYTDPAGKMTGGAGRALDTITTPKYKCLRNADGYAKTLVNGGAIAQARAARMPLVIVEGPFDAAACLAGGVPYVIALNGVAVRAEWFAGIPKVFIANDADTAGTEAVSAFKRSVPVHISHFAADDLEECKDVSEFWQMHGRLPAVLLAATTADARPQETDDSGPDPFAHDDPAWPSLEDLPTRTAEAERYARMTLVDLPDDYRTEAEDLGRELALDSEEALTFMAELLKHEHLLTAEERLAAWHVVTVANRILKESAT